MLLLELGEDEVRPYREAHEREERREERQTARTGGRHLFIPCIGPIGLIFADCEKYGEVVIRPTAGCFPFWEMTHRDTL